MLRRPYPREKRTRSDAPDITKRIGYVIADFVLRSISALGVVAIGYAGYQLQHQNSESSHVRQEHEQQIHKYLTTARGLTELELALSTVARDEAFDRSQGEQLARSASLVNQLARSLWLETEPAPIKLVVPTTGFSSQPNSNMTFMDIFHFPNRTISLSFRGAILMYSELLNACAVIEHFDATHKTEVVILKRLDAGTYALVLNDVMSDVPGDDRILPISAEGAAAWLSWIEPDRYIPLQSFESIRVLIKADPFVVAIQNAERRLITDHPDVGEDYVQMRNEAVKSWSRGAGSP